MLGRLWLYVTFLLLIAALISRQLPLLLVALLFFLSSGVARFWARYALERIDYTRRFTPSRVFLGESTTLEVSLANRKILPLPWVQVFDKVPKAVDFGEATLLPAEDPGRRIFTSTSSLSWYHRLTRRYLLQCPKRGHFSFGPATIRSGDLFGFFYKEIAEPKLDTLVVYPRIVPLEALGIPSRHPFGDIRASRHLFEDPVRVAGTRDYVPGEPLKRVHWKTTARLQRLQSKVFEPTTSTDLALFLDVRTMDPPMWGLQEQLLETAVMTVASIASHVLQQGQRVGVYVNESYQQTTRMIRIPSSEHPEQLQRVLEGLAHVQGFPVLGIDELLLREGRSLPWRTTLAVVTATPSPAMIGSLTRFQRSGRRVALVAVGAQATLPTTNGLTVYQVSDQVYWEQMASLEWSKAT